MYKTKNISPLDLYLDERNPRFRFDRLLSQEEIRLYMLKHEDVLELAQKMSDMNTVLPGERIIICSKDNKNIVLEGNRRTTIYQMFLDRNLIPDEYLINFPLPTDKFLNEIKYIQVDIVETRKEAMKFLAARHIEGVKRWSSISKWKISYQLFKEGNNIAKIAEYLAISLNTVKTAIFNYTILLKGLNNKKLSKKEKELLDPMMLKPDQFIRIFNLTVKPLGLSYTDSFEVKSLKIPDKVLDEIILMLIRKTFIEHKINTRSNYQDIESDIKSILEKNNISQDILEEKIPLNTVSSSPKTEKAKIPPSENDDDGHEENGDIYIDGNGSRRNLPYFFSGLKYKHISKQDTDGFGVTKICFELRKMSNSTNNYVKNFPIAASMLVRSLIEQSLIYYSKKHDDNNGKRIYDQISKNGNPEKLSKIIEKYYKAGKNFIHDDKIHQYFQEIFSGNNNGIAQYFNWIVHRPDEFSIDENTLLNIANMGLLKVVNYLIS